MALVYHYCSPQTFLQIVERGCIWLSSTNNMNDFAEGEWFTQALKKALIENEMIYGQKWCESAFGYFINNSVPKYIACFSKKNDSLSQWRAYAQDGEGVAIGFDDENFGAEGDTIVQKMDPKASLCIKDVQYKTRSEIKNDIIEQANIFRSADGDDSDLSSVLFAEVCTSLAMTMKNPAFEEEDERRLVYSAVLNGRNPTPPTRVLNPIGDIRHRISNGYLTSYFELEFPVENTIKEIILGPKNKFHETDVYNFLGLNSLGHVKFTRSSATYR